MPEDTGGSGAPAQEEEVLEPITPLLAAADPAAGEQLASRQCATCHTFNEGGAARVGPNLYDIVAHPIAAEGGFSYSSGLSDHSGDTWPRSEERSLGKEWVSTCRTWWSPFH